MEPSGTNNWPLGGVHRCGVERTRGLDGGSEILDGDSSQLCRIQGSLFYSDETPLTNLVQMAKEQREKAIEQAVAAGRPAMPRAVRGKLLTKYLRNGRDLCSRFQTGECREETCQEAHVCAVVNRTGRACEIRGAAGGPNSECKWTIGGTDSTMRLSAAQRTGAHQQRRCSS